MQPAGKQAVPALSVLWERAEWPFRKCTGRNGSTRRGKTWSQRLQRGGRVLYSLCCESKAMRQIPALALWCALTSVAICGPINIIETTDFQNFSPGPVIGILGAGLNTVSGSVNGATPFLLGDFQDSFELILPAGFVITSAQFIVTNFTFGNGLAHLDNGEILYTGGFAPITANGSYVLNNLLPPGTLDISILPADSTNNPGSIPPTGVVAGGFNYSLQYQVSAVPEPATAALLLGGLCLVLTEKNFVRCLRTLKHRQSPTRTSRS